MKYKVQQGECLISIAQKFGIVDWRTIYDHPENEAFKELRQNPNMICAGDEVYIPGLEGARVKAEANKKLTFVLRQAKAYFPVRLTNSKFEPLADISYTLSVYKSEKDLKDDPLQRFEDQKTDEDGFVEQLLPKGAKFAVLEYAPYESRPSLTLKKRFFIGELDDPRTKEGTRSRLNHFGFFSGEGRFNDESKELFSKQLEGFKEKYGLSDDESVVDFFENPTSAA
jgi:hypothetical protein